MLAGVIAAKTVQAAARSMQQYMGQVDVFEWRLDYLIQVEINAIATTLANSPHPVIVTLRSKNTGGHFQVDEQVRLQLLQGIAALGPQYLDIEHHVPVTWLEALAQAYPTLKLIRSFHDFTATPDDLSGVLAALKHPAVSIYKMVTMATSSLDSMRMARWVQQQQAQQPLVGHCLGAYGIASRLLGHVLGNYFDYVALETSTVAPGILDIDTWRDVYRLPRKKPVKQIYALLGDPVAHSLGAYFHNRVFSDHSIAALYIKIRLNAAELPIFFAAIDSLPFAGFSITMPLKRAVLHIPQVQADPATTAVAAANTLKKQAGAWQATNTDGLGAMQALSEVIALPHQRLLLLGAGATACAIAHTARTKYQMRIDVLNRTRAHAIDIVGHAHAYSFADHTGLADHYDVVVNTLPHAAGMDETVYAILAPRINAKSTYLAVDYAAGETVLSQKIRQLGAVVVSGEAMFVAQAEAQFKCWVRQ